jgi:thiosulfate dehydrogenase
MSVMKKQYIVIIGIASIILIYFLIGFIAGDYFKMDGNITSTDSTWVGPSIYIEHTTLGEERELIIYGQELIAHTSRYLGPKGSVAQITNGMNCQNCHLQAGAKAWGNNFAAVFSTYPKFRDRSGQIETIYKRVADCMERSLNGTAVDSNSREFKAIYAYIKWLGKDVQKNEQPIGSGIEKLPYLDRAADPQKGQIVYIAQCQTCHGANGEGLLTLDEVEYAYPPLWGPNSYNDGAGLYRLSNFAGYVKNNMPNLLSSHKNPTLTDEESWDIAAYVNSQSRPHKDQSKDWPKFEKKPLDFPFGPYADSFSEIQHKYGPFKPIQKFYNQSLN